MDKSNKYYQVQTSKYYTFNISNTHELDLARVIELFFFFKLS